MRSSSRFRHAATTNGFSTAGLSIIWPFLWTVVNTLSFTSVSEPELDLSSLGQVTFVGNFDSASLYSYTLQSNTAAAAAAAGGGGSQQAISVPLPNGVLTDFSTADSNILALCTLTDKHGRNPTIFAGGNFTSFGGVQSQGAALVDPNSGKVTALPGITGSVAAVLCDEETNSVYVGGDFSHADSNSSNALVWSGNHGGGWVDLSFGGFDGPVSSILKVNGSDIIFGGSFGRVLNATPTHHTPPQFVNIQNATVSSDSSSPLPGFNDPRNVICQTSNQDGPGKTWLLSDNSPGFWRAEMAFGFRPVKIRIYNTHYEGRGTKSFLLRALPDNGIMNLTYTDASSGGRDSFCDSMCPLPQDPREPYREFRLVNRIGMAGFQLEILQWYGSGGGLNGVEIFDDGKQHAKRYTEQREEGTMC